MAKPLVVAVRAALLLSLLHHVQSVVARDNGAEDGYQLFDAAQSMQDVTAERSYEDQASDLHGIAQWSNSVQDESGFSLSLRVMHRDSPFSPFRKQGIARRELLLERMKRDALRADTLTVRAVMAADGVKNSDLEVEKTVKFATIGRQAEAQDFHGPVVSGLEQGSGEYFTRIGVGTPARKSFLVLDTGSDISWLQCSPCSDCYSQTDPIFNPALSSSFQMLACTSPMCSKLDLHGCRPDNNRCLYEVAYGDGSFTTGVFSLETLSFKGATIKDVALGCGHDNEGLFVGAAGLLGLGAGTLSFPSQVGPHFNNKFSYCLVDRDEGGSSNVIFGDSAIPYATVFTPLLKNPKLETFYYVSLTGISVGRSRLAIPAAALQMDGNGNGGVILDSGTSVTRLVQAAYQPLRDAFREATSYLTAAGTFALFDTCYDLAGKQTITVPKVVLHFENGADVLLPAKNYLIPVDNSGTFCLAFARTAGELSIIGNIQQQGFRVVFDNQNAEVGFAANQCL